MDGANLLTTCVSYEDPGLTQECLASAVSPDDPDKFQKLPPAVKAKIEEATLKATDKNALSGGVEKVTKGFQGVVKSLTD